MNNAIFANDNSWNNMINYLHELFLCFRICKSNNKLLFLYFLLQRENKNQYGNYKAILNQEILSN